VIYKSLNLGWLDTAIINQTLKRSMPCGHVILTRTAHKHAAEKHPVDYPFCLPFLKEAIQNPSFIGYSLRNFDNIQVVFHHDALKEGVMLVALSAEPDDRGKYRVRTFYRISVQALTEKRVSGRLYPPKRSKLFS
jgi:hypothetical protein